MLQEVYHILAAPMMSVDCDQVAEWKLIYTGTSGADVMILYNRLRHVTPADLLALVHWSPQRGYTAIGWRCPAVMRLERVLRGNGLPNYPELARVMEVTLEVAARGA